MLLELKVSRFAIIEDIHVQFKPGLNILSGETGAGKSVLLKSLGLLMGAKSSSDFVPPDAKFAVIEGSFDLSHRPDLVEKLDELGIESSDGLLIVRRLVSPQGQSRIYLNGALSTLTHLRDLVSPLVEVTGPAVPLIEMTGQHDNKNLLARSYHLDLLDRAAGLLALKLDFQAKYEKSLSLQAELYEIQSESQNRAQRLDYLVYQKDEIEALDLKENEDLELEENVKKLRSLRKLVDFSHFAESLLSEDEDSVFNRLRKLNQRAAEIGKYDEHLSQLFSELPHVQTQLNDMLYSMSRYISDLESEPERLETYEKRLSDLRHLQKKFGPSVSDILEKLDDIRSEIETFENSDERAEEIEKEILVLQKEMKQMALALHAKRLEFAKKLSRSVNEELKDLNMKGVQFDISVEAREELGPNGYDLVEFLVRSGKTEPAKPLNKSASGGELSRILLSLKQVVGHSSLPRTYLFDEVDTGVSGETAEKVGRKLKSIAKGQQVICVTHLPQVAVHGDSHFLIEKKSSSKGTQMQIEELRGDTRVQEIARLISGEKITRTSLDHARQLLDAH